MAQTTGAPARPAEDDRPSWLAHLRAALSGRRAASRLRQGQCSWCHRALRDDAPPRSFCSEQCHLDDMDRWAI